MINQGEEIKFTGTFEQKVGSDWNTIINLSGYIIDALVINESGNKKFLFSSNTTDTNKKIVLDNTKGTYTFTITPAQSSTMIGECFVEVSLKNGNGAPIITDNRGKFVINESLLGRTLAKS